MDHAYPPAQGTTVGGQGLEDTDESDDSPDGDYDDEYNTSTLRPNPALWSTTAKKRGRAPKDPDAEHVCFDCKDVDDLEEKLRQYLRTPTVAPEHAIIEFHFQPSSAFMVYTRDYKRDSQVPWTPYDVPDLLRRTAVSVHDVMQPSGNEKEEIVRQKAVARVCVEAIQRADGFRYSFHNNWLSREDKAHRFSFFCNDSTLNKGRAAGGGQKGSGKTAKKPIYECNGLIAVKFSRAKNNLEVHYRHIPVHQTYEERAPPPRPKSKRYRLLEILNPEALQNQKSQRKKTKTGEATKRGRLRKARDLTNQHDTNTRQDSELDRGLQPLIDFIERAESMVQEAAQIDGGDLSDAVADEPNIRLSVGDINMNTAGTRIDRSHQQSGNDNTPKRGQKRKANSNNSGVDSAQAGSITWINNETPHTIERVVRGVGEAATTPVEPLSEIELLKQKLQEAEERIQKLEAARANPYPAYPPYPPYPYPHPYSFPPPPPGYGYPPYVPTTSSGPTASASAPPLPVGGAAITSPAPASQAMAQAPPPLLIQAPTSSGDSATINRTARIATSPAITTTPVSANPASSPAYSHSPNSARTGPSPMTPHPMFPPAVPQRSNSRTQTSISTANPPVTGGRPSQRQNTSQNTPTPASISVSVENYRMAGIYDDRPPNPNISVSAARNAASRPQVDTSQDPPVHYFPVSNITANSWAPVVVTGSKRGSSKNSAPSATGHGNSVWSTGQSPTTMGNGFNPTGTTSLSISPVSARPSSTGNSTALGPSVLAGIEEAAAANNG